MNLLLALFMAQMARLEAFPARNHLPVVGRLSALEVAPRDDFISGSEDGTPDPLRARLLPANRYRRVWPVALGTYGDQPCAILSPTTSAAQASLFFWLNPTSASEEH